MLARAGSTLAPTTRLNFAAPTAGLLLETTEAET
jgi:hypothetical protein